MLSKVNWSLIGRLAAQPPGDPAPRVWWEATSGDWIQAWLATLRLYYLNPPQGVLAARAMMGRADWRLHPMHTRALAMDAQFHLLSMLRRETRTKAKETFWRTGAMIVFGICAACAVWGDHNPEIDRMGRHSGALYEKMQHDRDYRHVLKHPKRVVLEIQGGW